MDYGVKGLYTGLTSDFTNQSLNKGINNIDVKELAISGIGGAIVTPLTVKSSENLFSKYNQKVTKFGNDNTFKNWLNKGTKNNSVYIGIDKNNTEVYTGITKQELSKRLYQHNYNGKGFTRLEAQYSNITRNQARSLEQYLIENGSANELNKINSISKKSKYYISSMWWADSYIKNLK